MSPQHYDVVYDILSTAYAPPLFPFVVGAVAIGVSVVAALLSRDRKVRNIGLAIAGGAVLFGGFSVWRHWLEFRHLRNATAAGQTTTLEGWVTGFRPDIAGGGVPQVFSVQEHTFLVRRADITAGFRETVSVGGPDLTGRFVRVTFAQDDNTVEERIVWLGIRRVGCQ